MFLFYRSDGGQSGNVVPSADQVALSLLSNFNDYHLPKADQLVWLVSEKEAPQAVSSYLLMTVLVVIALLDLIQACLECKQRFTDCFCYSSLCIFYFMRYLI